MNSDFLLKTAAAKRLYHTYAEPQPILDYHCHIPASEIAQDKHYADISDVWLGADHYKWRQMRICGVDERLITGNASPLEKFRGFASIMPELAGNPLYTWCRLELSRYFGIETLLSAETADEIFEQANAKLCTMSARSIISGSHVFALCTTDDPTADLTHHKQLAADRSFAAKVLPAFRPDRALSIEKADFCDYMQALGAKTLDELTDSLDKKLGEFVKAGAVAADCGMTALPSGDFSKADCERILADRLNGKMPTAAEENEYKAYLLSHLLTAFSEQGLVCEIHFGVERNINQAAFEVLGADAGFDVIGRHSVEGLKTVLDRQQQIGKLPKVLLYSLRPQDNAELLSICGAFAEAGVRGKVQQGSAWWFNDTKTGMQKQISDFAELSALGTFVGMLTDSRSVLSYTRHEYFRRILCNYVGNLVEHDEFPDEKAAGKLIEKVCFENAKNFFGL